MDNKIAGDQSINKLSNSDTKNDVLKWLDSIHRKTKKFLDLLAEDNYKYFKYSLSGDLYNRQDNWGLAQLVFAAKVFYMLGLLEVADNKNSDLSDIILKPEQVINIANSIQKYQDDEGYISDPLIIRLLRSNLRFSLFNKKNNFKIEKIKRAETRQAFAALNCLGYYPLKPFLNIPANIKEVEYFLRSFDWSHPWDAGSHFSHLLFFLSFNKKMLNFYKNNNLSEDHKNNLYKIAGKFEKADELIQHANNWVDLLQNKNDGFWYKKNANILEKINGAMKILTGKEAAGINYINYHERIIDGCLSAVNDNEACSNFNIVYVLYYCSNISDYKKQEIQEFCYNRLKIYKHYYFEDTGGFSFYRNKANDYYYGALITKGLNEPDIHGTVLFIWGISLISKILNLGYEFKIPIT